MGKSVITDHQYRYSDQGYVVDNVAWQDEIKRRLWEEAQRAQAAMTPAPEAVPALLEELAPPAPTAEELKAQEAAKAAEEAQALKEQAEETARRIEEEARARGRQIEKTAQAQAEQLIAAAGEKAKTEAEKIKAEAAEAGRKDGYDSGYQAGLGEGKTEGQKAYSGVVGNLSSVLQKTVEERKELLGEMKPLLVDLVGEALQACLKKKAKSGPIVVHFVEEALKKAVGRASLKVHLNPADAEAVEAEIQNLQLAVGAGEIELVPDARIEQGGCLLETEAGSVDAQIPTVVGQVKDALRDKV
ncbi:MAG TPA: FliH/SctL family protein [bacterium]|nr:FliH/SctL family protein [bacterium]